MSLNPTESNTPFGLPSTTRLGHVHLTVNSLDRQIEFYTRVLKFKLHWREGAEAALGTDAEVLLRLTEDPAARRVRQSTGLYHFAVLYPSRKELARAMAWLFTLRYPNAPTDHAMSKTTYLDDAEGNTVELYVRSLEDGRYEVVNGRPVAYYSDGRIGSGADPLDVEALFRELDEMDPLDTPLPEGTRIGHVHLYASSIEPMMDFYAGTLGFQEGLIAPGFPMADVGLDAAQNHVVAWNNWKGSNLPPAPPDALGMRYFTVVLPDADALERVIERVQAAGVPVEQTPEGVLVRDPAQINVVLTDRMSATHK